MIKIEKDSRIEIWSSSYINGTRNECDKNMSIIQIEASNNGDNYMVEIIDKSKKVEEEKND